MIISEKKIEIVIVLNIAKVSYKKIIIMMRLSLQIITLISFISKVAIVNYQCFKVLRIISIEKRRKKQNNIESNEIN